MRSTILLLKSRGSRQLTLNLYISLVKKRGCPAFLWTVQFYYSSPEDDVSGQWVCNTVPNLFALPDIINLIFSLQIIHLVFYLAIWLLQESFKSLALPALRTTQFYHGPVKSRDFRLSTQFCLFPLV